MLRILKFSTSRSLSPQELLQALEAAQEAAKAAANVAAIKSCTLYLGTGAPVFGAESYAVYRGWVSDLVDLDLDGLPDAGYGVCQDVATPTDPGFMDPLQPPSGEGWFYLVGFVGPLGERGLGTTSAGLARESGIACP